MAEYRMRLRATIYRVLVRGFVCLLAISVLAVFLVLSGVFYIYADQRPLPEAAPSDRGLHDLFHLKRQIFEELRRRAFDESRLTGKDSILLEKEHPLIFGWPSARPQFSALLKQISQSDNVEMGAVDGCLRLALAGRGLPSPDSFEKGVAWNTGGCDYLTRLRYSNTLDDINTLPASGAQMKLDGKWVIYLSRGVYEANGTMSDD